MFINLANSIIRKNIGNINEGAITTQDTSEPITNAIKEIINGLTKKIERFNQQAPLFQGQVDIIIDDINNAIEQKFGNKPVPIAFAKLKPTTYGVYRIKQKVINLNYNVFLVDKIKEAQEGTPEEEQRLYKIKDVNNIDFDQLDETLSHELIHQQQDERSGGKYFNDQSKSLAKLYKKYDINKDGELDNDEYNKISDTSLKTFTKNNSKEYQQKFGEILDNKKIREKYENELKNQMTPEQFKVLTPEQIKDKFTKRVEYLNGKVELNTWAKDTVQKYVSLYYKMFLNKKIPVSVEEIRDTVLAPFMNAADTNVFKTQPQQESVQPDTYQQPVQNTQQQQPVQNTQQQQPVQQQQPSQKNQELRNKLQQNKKVQQQSFTIPQGTKERSTKLLLDMFPEYYLLTSPNKQKWWTYTYQILNKTKFKPIGTDQ